MLQLQCIMHPYRLAIIVSLGGVTTKWNSILTIGEAWIAGMHGMQDAHNIKQST